MAWLHTWSGLVVGWVLFFVFATGTAGYFVYEIDRWMRPELPLRSAQPLDAAAAVGRAEAHLAATAAGATQWTINLPGGRGQSGISLFWQAPATEKGQRSRFQRATLDTETGTVVREQQVRKTGGGHLLYRMHYELRYMPYAVAIRIVGVCAMLMFMAILTGIITHKKIFTDFFTFRPGKGQRSWLDAHNLISVTSLPFFLMITYSGLVFFMYEYVPAGVQAAYGMQQEHRQRYFDELQPESRTGAAGQPATLVALASVVQQAEARWGTGQVGGLTVRHPGDSQAVITVRAREDGAATLSPARLRFSGVTGASLDADASTGAARTTHATLLALHEGRFAGPVMRWLYFLCGLLGCAMIATGLVLWTVKRQVKQDKRRKAGDAPEFGFRLVQALNIGTIAGLPIAIAVYFCANRLIPADFAARRVWEVHALFIAWGVMLVYPALRPNLRAWVESLWLAALVFVLVPLVNACTTDRHLGITLPAGDWALAGFDLTMLALGLCFAMMARKVRRRLQASATPIPAVTPRAMKGKPSACAT